MPTRRSISLLALLGLPPGPQTFIPDDIRTELDKLAALDYRVATSPGAHVYFGTIRSIGEAFFPSSLNWPVELPMVNAGVPFQLTRRRRAPGSGQNLEP